MMKKIYSLIAVLFLAVSVLGASGAMANCSGVDQDSSFYKTLNEYTLNRGTHSGSCWFCPIFTTMYDAINKLATDTFTSLAKAFGGLLGMGILFFLLFKVGKMLVQLQEVDLMQFLNDLFKPLGRAIIAAALLGLTSAVVVTDSGKTGLAKENAFSIVMTPIMDISLTLGTQVMNTALKDVVQTISLGDRTMDRRLTRSTLNCSLKSRDRRANMALEGDSSHPDEGARGLLICWMEQVSSSFMVGMSAGASMAWTGFKKFWKLDGLGLCLVGTILMVGFFFIYLMFPFKLLNAFTRIAFVLTLMPLWIVLWVFPPTVQYTKKAWEMFASSCIFFVVLSVMIALTIILVNESIPANVRQELYACLLSDDTDKAADLVPFGGGAIMNVLAFMAMGYSLLEQAEPLANTFISAGGNLTIGNQMASFAAKGAGLASRPATWAAGKAGGAVAGVGKKAMSKVGGAIGSARRATIGHFAGAGGDLPTTGDKFKRALFGAGLGKGYFDTVSGKTDAPEGIAGSFGRLTSSAAGAVSSKANTTLDKMKAAAQNKDKNQARDDLQKMINDSKSAEERQAKIAAAQQLLKNGKVDDKTADSLKDAYALQEMSANRMNDKDFAAKMNAVPADAKKKTDEMMQNFGMASEADRERMIAAATTPAEKELLKQANEQIIDKGFVSSLTKAEMQYLQEQKEFAKLGATQSEIAQVSGSVSAGALDDATPQRPYDEEGVSALAGKSDVSANLDRLVSDLAAIEAAVASAKSMNEVKDNLAAHHWESGSERDMMSAAERIFTTRGHEGAAGHAAQSMMNDFMARMGVYGTAANNVSREMGQRVSEAASKGEVARLSALVAELKRQIDTKKG